MNRNLISFSELVFELRKMHQNKLSGTLLIKTDHGHLAQFNISNGDILFLSMAKKRGMEALADIIKINTCSFQFLHNTISGLKLELAPTVEILNYLATRANDTVAANASRIPEKVKIILKETLATFIGPAALIVGDGALEKAKSLEAALDTLANEIPNAKDSLTFKEVAKNKLDAHL